MNVKAEPSGIAFGQFSFTNEYVLPNDLQHMNRNL